ncbi:MAG TPA: minor capsid protein, partial [Roseiflexaceae bacterium]|nr:minor capsid protein [Roseiflexaceae bacterium]
VVIARTETAGAYSRGSILAWQESGVVTHVEWLSTVDSETAPECRALNGQRVPLGSAFSDGAKHPPRHPACRCVLLALILE